MRSVQAPAAANPATPGCTDVLMVRDLRIPRTGAPPYNNQLIRFEGAWVGKADDNWNFVVKNITKGDGTGRKAVNPPITINLGVQDNTSRSNMRKLLQEVDKIRLVRTAMAAPDALGQYEAAGTEVAILMPTDGPTTSPVTPLSGEDTRRPNPLLPSTGSSMDV